jgi:hypothetical protein
MGYLDRILFVGARLEDVFRMMFGIVILVVLDVGLVCRRMLNLTPDLVVEFGMSENGEVQSPDLDSYDPTHQPIIIAAGMGSHHDRPNHHPAVHTPFRYSGSTPYLPFPYRVILPLQVLLRGLLPRPSCGYPILL